MGIRPARDTIGPLYPTSCTRGSMRWLQPTLHHTARRPPPLRPSPHDTTNAAHAHNRHAHTLPASAPPVTAAMTSNPPHTPAQHTRREQCSTAHPANCQYNAILNTQSQCPACRPCTVKSDVQPASCNEARQARLATQPHTLPLAVVLPYGTRARYGTLLSTTAATPAATWGVCCSGGRDSRGAGAAGGAASSPTPGFGLYCQPVLSCPGGPPTGRLWRHHRHHAHAHDCGAGGAATEPPASRYCFSRPKASSLSQGHLRSSPVASYAVICSHVARQPGKGKGKRKGGSEMGQRAGRQRPSPATHVAHGSQTPAYV